MLTGHASQSSAVEAVDAGAFSYLQKPFDVEQLLITVKRAVERHDAEARLRRETTVNLLLAEAASSLITPSATEEIARTVSSVP